EDYAGAAGELRLSVTGRAPGPEFKRVLIDVQIQSALGMFFAAKFRAAVLYRIHEKTGDLNAIKEALVQYRRARTAWAEMAQGPAHVYVSDITVGEHPQLRGHWIDRLPQIDRDIENMEK